MHVLFIIYDLTDSLLASLPEKVMNMSDPDVSSSLSAGYREVI